MLSKLLLLAPIASVYAGDCTAVNALQTAACTCGSGTDTCGTLTKYCVHAVGATGTCKTTGDICANNNGSAAVTDGCFCKASGAAAASDVVCAGFANTCIGTACLESMTAQVSYLTQAANMACGTGTAPCASATHYCNASGACTTLVAVGTASHICAENTTGTVACGGSASICLGAGNTGTAYVDYDVVCPTATTMKCLNADELAGTTFLLKGTPACVTNSLHWTTNAPADCKVDQYNAPNTICKVNGDGTSKNFCGQKAYVKTGALTACTEDIPASNAATTMCQASSTAAAANVCVCSEDGGKHKRPAAGENICQTTDLCLSNTVWANYTGTATCITFTTNVATSVGAVSACSVLTGATVQADATNAAKAAPCTCGSKICGPGKFCYKATNANYTSLAANTDECLSSAVAACAATDGSAVTGTTVKVCNCGTGDVCGATEACLSYNTTRYGAGTSDHCLPAVVGNCNAWNTTAGAAQTANTAVCKCNAVADHLCGSGQYCMNNTNVFSCTGTVPTLAPTSAPAPTAAPTAETVSGASPVNSLIAFAVTLLSLTISALL